MQVIFYLFRARSVIFPIVRAKRYHKLATTDYSLTALKRHEQWYLTVKTQCSKSTLMTSGIPTKDANSPVVIVPSISSLMTSTIASKVTFQFILFKVIKI